MVPTAQGDAVFDVGGTIISPMYNVMNFAPASWYGTPRKCASAVPNNDRSADRGGYGGLARPTSSGSPRAPRTTGMTWASQAIRRATSALSGPPNASEADPIRPRNTARSMVTTTWGRSPPSVGRSPASNARWASSTRASASRCRGGAQVDLGVADRTGRRQRAQCRADDLDSFPVEPSGQLIATVAVTKAEVSPGVGRVVGAPTVLIQIAEDSLAQRLQLPGIEGAGVVG